MPRQALQSPACMFTHQPFWFPSLIEDEAILLPAGKGLPVHLIKFQPDCGAIETIPGMGQFTLVFSCDPEKPEAWCCGVQEKREPFDIGNGHFLFCRFQPGEFARLFPVEANLLTNQILPLEDILPEHFLPEQVAMESDFLKQCAIIERFLRARNETTGSSQRLCQEIIGQIRASCGNLQMDDLAHSTSYSKRWIQQIVLTQVGTTPKRLLSHMKIQCALKRMQESDIPLSQLAQELGFYDQSHFSKQFKEDLGFNPGEFLKLQKTGRQEVRQNI